MLKFYTNSDLSHEVTAKAPKKFSVPLKGGKAFSSLWLADTYAGKATAAALSGANTLTLDNTQEFKAAGGQAKVKGVTFNYTGKTQSTLTGITGLTTAVAIGDAVKPKTTYGPGTSNLRLMAICQNEGVGVQVAAEGYGPGSSVLLGRMSILDTDVIQIDVTINVQPGDEGILDNITIEFPTLALGNVQIVRRDQGLPQFLRLLPANRQVISTAPGFIFGESRWRDKESRNAQALVPASWDIDPATLGIEKFASGIGHDNDLEPLAIEENQDSIQLRVNHGSYFHGPSRYYLPAGAVLDKIPAKAGTYPLSDSPKEGTPVFVGTLARDSQMFFEKESEYRLVREFDGDNQFTLLRKLPANQPRLRETFAPGWENQYSEGPLSLMTNGGIISIYGGIDPLLKPEAWTGTDSQFARARLVTRGDVMAFGDWFALYLRTTQDWTRGYWGAIESNGNGTFKFYIGKWTPTADWIVLAEVNVTEIPSGVLEFTARGSELTLWFNGKKMVTAYDNDNASGTPGFSLWNTHAPFGLLEVADLTFGDVPPGQQVTLSNGLPERQLFLGCISGQATEYFSLPLIPVDGVQEVYIKREPSADNVKVPFTYDEATGNITLLKTQLDALGQNIAKQEQVWTRVSPALAVLYETGTEDSVLIPAEEVDLNPAFSGVSEGHVYLQHRKQAPVGLTLAVDKPRIAVPATHESVIDLIAFGPCYYDGDFALLTATAMGSLPEEKVPGATLVVEPGSDFRGMINYQVPTAQNPVKIRTGGDGKANFIYTPLNGFGRWISKAVAGHPDAKTLLLTGGVPFSQLWNAREGWLVKTYEVQNDNPLFGKVGAQINYGEIDWYSNGRDGFADYRTNGLRQLVTVGEGPLLPQYAWDAAGKRHDDGLFNGTAVKLTYATDLPNTAKTGAYFISYVERVSLKLRVEGSNVVSNTVLLQMAVPEVIFEQPWLIINDAVQGRLNQYRLGWTRNI